MTRAGGSIGSTSPELLIEQREFTPLQRMAEELVKEHDALLDRYEDRPTSIDFSALFDSDTDFH